MGSNGETSFGLLMIVLCTILFIIVLLNLLIAVVGDTYEKIQEEQASHIYIEQCSMMLDIEILFEQKITDGIK